MILVYTAQSDLPSGSTSDLIIPNSNEALFIADFTKEYLEDLRYVVKTANEAWTMHWN